MRRLVTEPEDLYLLLDSLLREPKLFWNGFYSDRKKIFLSLVTYPMKI